MRGRPATLRRGCIMRVCRRVCSEGETCYSEGEGGRPRPTLGPLLMAILGFSNYRQDHAT